MVIAYFKKTKRSRQTLSGLGFKKIDISVNAPLATQGRLEAVGIDSGSEVSAAAFLLMARRQNISVKAVKHNATR